MRQDAFLIFWRGVAISPSMDDTCQPACFPQLGWREHYAVSDAELTRKESA
jgi:hypothetical protein